MSRAFVKEQDDEPEQPAWAARAVDPHFVTAAGLSRLRRELEDVLDPKRRAEMERRIDAAVVLEPPADRSVVAFGATVTVSGAAPEDQAYTIVGDVEADVAAHRIGLGSPLATALLGARVNDTIVWHRPIGDRSLTVRKIEYQA